MRDYDELVKRLREHNGWALNETLDQAADAIEKLSKPNWISVEERLPEEEKTVLVVRKFLSAKGVTVSVYVETAELIGGDWVSMSDEYKIIRYRHTDPIYWMPLPEPPKEAPHEL